MIYLNKNLFVIEIPFLTTRLSSYWVDLITPVKASLARPLIDSLVHDTVVTDNSITKIIPLQLKPVRAAIDIATKEMQKKIPMQKFAEEKTGFKVNQRILMTAPIIRDALNSVTGISLLPNISPTSFRLFICLERSRLSLTNPPR